MYLNTMSRALLTLAFMITSVLTATLSNPVTRTINNNGGAVFKGDYGGHAYELNGTVHEVMAQLKALYPEVELPKRDNSDIHDLIARNTINPPLCIPVAAWGWQNAPIPNIQNCVNQLAQFGGRVPIGPGPANCERICCDMSIENWGAELVLCNDNPWYIEPALPYLGSYATGIINQCPSSQAAGVGWTGGQMFDTDGYNIIVKATSDQAHCAVHIGH